jgi:inhibitor of cysteine peptidase
MSAATNYLRFSMAASISVLACAAALFPAASPADAQKYVVVGEQQSGTVASIGISQLLIIQLPSQPSTGYKWQVAQFGKSLCKVEELSPDQVKQLEADGILPKTNGTGLMGAVEEQVFQLTPLSKGATRIQLNYVRPWQPSAVAKQFSLTVHIGM